MFSVKSSAHPVKKQNSAALTTSAKKRFSARLRKIRWLIYKNIRSRKRNLTKILSRYKKLIKKFHETFFKLQPREISIWQEKLAKTCGDVQAVPRKGKKTKPQRVKNVKEDQPTQKCDCCCPIMSNYVVRLDSVLVKIYALLNLVQVDQTQAEATFAKPEFHEAPAKEIDEVHKPVKAENSIEEFDTEDEEISGAPAADKVVAKNDATVLVDKSESSVSDDDPDDAAASIVNMLNCEKTSDGCYAISKDEQFRRSAMAFYKQPKSLK